MAELPQVLDGETHPVAIAYRGYADLLRFIASRDFRIPAQDVESLVNDVFVSFLRHHGRIRDARAWLTGAMRNTCAEYWRRYAGASSGDERVPPEAERWRDSVATRLDIRRVLDQLSEHCRRVLFLRYFEELSVDELATQLEVKPNNAKQIVHRCKSAARVLFMRMRERDQ